MSMDVQQLEIELEKVKGETTRNTGRIKELERKTDAVNKLAESVAVMAEHMKTMDEKIDEMQDSVQELTAKPGKRWDLIITGIVTALVSAIVGFVLAKVGMG